MRIKVIELGGVVKENKYFVLPLKYEEGGKVQDKKFFSFNDAYKTVKELKEGQFYDVKLNKDKNGYWQWETITEASGMANSQSSGSGNSRGFETPEERARRQVLIVRQSCLAQAVIVKGVGEENADNITELAEKFEEWVMRD